MTDIPSVGDILMLSQVAWKIGRAFTAGRKGAPLVFLEAETDVNTLAKALKALAGTLSTEAEDTSLKRVNPQTQKGLSVILLSCHRTVHDLDTLIDRYQITKRNRKDGGFAIERTWTDTVLTSYKSISWTSEGGDIQDLRHLLQLHASVVLLTRQAIQSLSRLEEVVPPMAEKIQSDLSTTQSLNELLEDLHLTVTESDSLGSMDLDSKEPNRRKLDPISFAKLNRNSDDLFPQHVLINDYIDLDLGPRGPPPTIPLPKIPIVTMTDASPTTPTTRPTSPNRKRVSDFSFSGSTVRYSGSSISSDGAASPGWPSPTGTHKGTRVSRSASMKKRSKLPSTPEMGEPLSRPDSTTLSALPPPALDMDDLRIERATSVSSHGTQSELKGRHRSSTTATQEALFEKEAFRNSAILCDIRCSLVEYAQQLSQDDPSDVQMVTVGESCRVLVVRKREPISPYSTEVQTTTSIWTFTDDNTIRMQLRMSDDDVYVPYSSYFNPGKISITVPCELKYHDVKFGDRLQRTASTSWINYVFDNPKGAASFQNELMGRTLLASWPTSKTMRIHEGFSGTFSYAEQMCGMENLRIWEDDETRAIIALIHFSAHFRNGYLAFYLNARENMIKVKDDGGTQVKIKGLRVPLEGKNKSRKDSAIAFSGKDGVSDKKKFITGCKVEFESEEEKMEFIGFVKKCQENPRDLPDLLGVN
ncbi:hypothetical protein BU24DRAFT_352440 [Aaosphaeria arxii CBS 175.79]|uniref:Uncharacterized protein n=1 Tax=Aaosphaeria arxii CBS 175.79 TaxID=1450172 RepID=A0A6A5XHL9_9PLEO|nr:uncharacterized protein BU24DRAFT_352440 [Aaosphaeria arxii CBS 175.79]KAF2012612.1 hypothetical protein BU24DRAFT_352440 [Aaosphaeria arxii CBS 175.79]